VVDQLLDFDLPLLERKCSEPVFLEEWPDLVIAAIDAKPGNARGGEIKNDLGRIEAAADDRLDSALVERVEGSATTSTFSRDIAYSESPAASRALLRS
jgi:hypothetical protein